MDDLEPVAPFARMLGVHRPAALHRLDSLFRAASDRSSVAVMAAMAVPDSALDHVLRTLRAYSEASCVVEAQLRYNVWIAVASDDSERVRMVLSEIAAFTGLAVLHVPLDEIEDGPRGLSCPTERGAALH
ncbi:MAG: hypothetical protein HQL41_00055 [Alphaproteobacteria bacterium]|nr:hypothetical protein [Alphaproteobacteria bacterium]